MRVCRHRRRATDRGAGAAQVFKGKIYQLTWQTETCLVYDLDSWDPLAALPYIGPGWGLTHDATHLIMSDGSARLAFRSPDTFAVEREAPLPPHFPYRLLL
jgi:glutamine cyclotransferase